MCKCPVCGTTALEYVYKDKWDDVVGCDICVSTVDYYDYEEECEENEEALKGDEEFERAREEKYG